MLCRHRYYGVDIDTMVQTLMIGGKGICYAQLRQVQVFGQTIISQPFTFSSMWLLTVWACGRPGIYVVGYEKRDHIAQNNISYVVMQVILPLKSVNDITVNYDSLPTSRPNQNFGDCRIPIEQTFENIAYHSFPHVTRSLPRNHGYSLLSQLGLIVTVYLHTIFLK